MKKTGELKYKMGLLILLQNIDKIEERDVRNVKNHFLNHTWKKDGIILWYNNDNNLKPRHL